MLDNEGEQMAITKEQVLENLKAYIGKRWMREDVINCCKDYYGEQFIYIWYCNAEYDYMVCAESDDFDQFFIKDNPGGTMKEVWAE